MVNGSAVFVREMLPLVVLVALKLVNVLLPPKVKPPTELVVTRAPLIKPAPDSAIVLVEVKVTLLLAPAARLPVMLMAPVLFTLTLPVPA